MIVLRPIDWTIGEMKRPYLGPEARGRALAQRVIARPREEAARLNDTELRLDTPPMLGEAQALAGVR